jgi:lipopolysaccharide transport system ATP-binding protein
MEPILEVIHLSKKYRIHHQGNGHYLSLRERLLGIYRNRKKSEDFLALDDISFELKAGESLGIIGRNGAGKSTLLKILSKITYATKGKIISRGRIASLLEVGTGFHPELTGRENIFFNGSLLGMRNREIETKFDEIVAFSGVEKFLDTALKHYSSGMQLRLAFSVAAFLEPEILIIDEVLAVGDAEFQKKCLGKMEDVSKSGRTILFVSHQLGMVSQLCKRAVLLDKGRMLAQGQVTDVINEYAKVIHGNNQFVNDNKDQDKPYFVQSVRTLNAAKNDAHVFGHDDVIIVEVNFICRQQVRNTHLLVAVNNKNGQRIFSSDAALDDYKIETNKRQTAYLKIPKETLTPGNYSFFLAIHNPNITGYDVKDNICAISVYDNASEFAQFENKWFYGDVFLKCNWEFINPN